ncbi:anaphase-promoting complex, cyclosome, subunit 3 [Halobacteriovorax sp. BALOs_7]|uniref:Tetratricopeptide repeat protein n=1 Tax=Halobacteriovorax vibrionivorans TaxID=2152716 RepID=A0ABY0IJ44_9BACT|nr:MULTISPECIES: tetratricopeptide repeat protein [Halobacteriovorax]AYF45943.1 anaphase-promoting complex, cyclosome, subunit 3 [Halobacteriovorax sp. BALOs_7]RZF22976.1 tetratricopeptide repeat protein [Halobacteriovorax vibrionivorans]TGD46881.1 tetratricopeptide repeat protein [Halobacteriovorax sp. Y22]
MMKSFEQEKLSKKAKVAFDNREFNKAISIYNELLDIDPKDADALFSIANIFHLTGEISKAIKAFKKVLEVRPDHTDAAVSLSVLYNDIGQYEEASKIFQVASQKVKVNSKSSELNDNHIDRKFAIKHYELADLYLTYNRFDEALFEYGKVLKLDPENLEARVKIAKVYAKKGFVNKSFEELSKLKNERPDYLPGRIALGVLHYGKGDVLNATSEWEKVVSVDPLNNEAQMYLNFAKNATETTL